MVNKISDTNTISDYYDLIHKGVYTTSAKAAKTRNLRLAIRKSRDGRLELNGK